MKSPFILLIIGLSIAIGCNHKEPLKEKKDNPILMNLLNNYYHTMSDRAWHDYKDFFVENGTLTTVWAEHQDSIAKISTYTITEFLAQTKDGPDSQPIFEEKLVSADIKMKNNLANAWVKYEAKFGTKDQLMEWKGIDLFSFIKYNEEWKIVSIVYESEE